MALERILRPLFCLQLVIFSEYVKWSGSTIVKRWTGARNKLSIT